MPGQEVRTVKQYDRWMRQTGPVSAGMRLLMSPAGQFLVNTPAFRLPEEVQIKPEHRLLDVGCRRAALLRILASRVGFTTPPIGLDASTTMLELASHDIKADEPPVELIAGTATELPFADDQFDYLISAHVLKHLSDDALLQSLREMRRVLRPGGLAIAWDFAPVSSDILNRWNRWVITRGVSSANLRSYRRLADIAERAGFDWCGNAKLRPFLYPPVPRASIVMGKAPPDWTP